jgi:hypothetical protein
VEETRPGQIPPGARFTVRFDVPRPLASSTKT